MSRSTLFFTGGGKITNKATSLYNTYKPGGGGIGGSSISNRRAKNRLATGCNGNTCFPCYNRLGLYANNPNGYVPCLDNEITPTPTPTPLIGSLTFSFDLINPFARMFSLINPPTKELISKILPMVTVPGLFEITHNSTITGNTVYVEIQTFLYEQPTYTSHFGLGFNKTYRDPEIPGPDIPLRIFYNAVYNLTFTSSNNCPFSKLGSQFKGLNRDFNILPSFKPYFLQGTSLISCFEDCDNFNSDISDWDVSTVTDMSSMFKNAYTFKQDISNWSPYACTNMTDMFLGCDINDPESNTNQDHYNALLSSWGITKLPNMKSNVTFNVGYSKYSSSDAVTGWNNLTTVKGWTITDGGIPKLGSFSFSYEYTGSTPIDEAMVINNLPVITLPDVFDITPIVDLTNLPTVTVTISSILYESSSYPGNFGFTFINVWSFFINNVNILDLISSNNFPFSRQGYQFNGLENISFTIQPGFEPYFLPETSLEYCFAYTTFNSDISNWVTTNVTDMRYMFGNANVFNQDISLWDVSNVTNMSSMFQGAISFKQDLSNWSPYACTSMNDMFLGCDLNNPNSIDNQDNYNALLESWGTEPKLSNLQQEVAFNVGTSRYSSAQAILGKTNLTSVKQWTITDGGIPGPTTIGMLEFSYEYTGSTPIDEAMVINNLPVITLPGVFDITPIVDLTNLPTVTVTISSILYESSIYPNDFGFKCDNVSAFYNSGDISGLTFISSSNFPFSIQGYQFNGLSGSFIIQPGFQPYFLPGTSLSFCFGYCSNFNSDISNWKTLNVNVMDYMFSSATSFNQPINYNPGTDAWNTSNVTDMSYMFYNATSFDQQIGLWDTSNVTDMNGMFYDAVLFNQPINYNPGTGSWNTSSVTTMGYMFYNATSFDQQIDLWNTSNVTDMNSMFYNAVLFNVDISSWDVSRVTDMRNLFANTPIFNQDISSWVTSSVTYMNGMFYNATNFNQPINTSVGGTNWNTSNVTDISFMFHGASAFNQPIGSWDTSNVTSMSYMFFEATTFNQDISSWDVSNVLFMDNMFQGATAFKQNISNWTPYACITMYEMFVGVDMNNPNSTSNQTNYNALLESWGTNPKLSNLQSNVEFNGGNSKYSGSSAITGRDNLTNINNWLITDGGL